MRRDVRSWIPGPQIGLLLALFALGATPGLPDWIGTLRGTDRLEAELDETRALGYYEGLLDAVAPTVRAMPRVGSDARSGVEPEAHGTVPFREAGLAEADPGFLLLRLRRDLEVSWNGTTFRTNALGLRGPDLETRKPPGTLRVVVLGSSNTLAQGVDDEDGYVRLLERWLAERVGSGRRVEVVNLSVSGYGPTQRLHRLRTEVEALDPDWILADASALDLYLEEIHLRAVVRNGHPIPHAFVRSALAKAHVSAEDDADGFGRKLREVHQDLLDGTYAGMADAARRLGVPLTVVILPRVDARKDNSRMYRRIRDAARGRGLVCLDLSNAFDSGDLDAYRHGPWDGHPDPRGHRRIFDRLVRAIDRAGGLSALLGSPRVH